MKWVCDVCGSESDEEDAPCACDDDTSGLLVTIKQLRAENAALRAKLPPVAPVMAIRRDDERRSFLTQKIASNKLWLQNNWTLGRRVRQDCQENIDRDEAELARLNAEDV